MCLEYFLQPEVLENKADFYKRKFIFKFLYNPQVFRLFLCLVEKMHASVRWIKRNRTAALLA